eukprot:1139938-Pelagomonas_calceolata.AAC.2
MSWTLLQLTHKGWEEEGCTVGNAFMVVQQLVGTAVQQLVDARTHDAGGDEALHVLVHQHHQRVLLHLQLLPVPPDHHGQPGVWQCMDTYSGEGLLDMETHKSAPHSIAVILSLFLHCSLLSKHAVPCSSFLQSSSSLLLFSLLPHVVIKDSMEREHSCDVPSMFPGPFAPTYTRISVSPTVGCHLCATQMGALTMDLIELEIKRTEHRAAEEGIVPAVVAQKALDAASGKVALQDSPAGLDVGVKLACRTGVWVWVGVLVWLGGWECEWACKATIR